MTLREILMVDYLEERVEVLGRALLELDVRSEKYTAAILEIDRISAILDFEDRPHLRIVRDGRESGAHHG